MTVRELLKELEAVGCADYDIIISGEFLNDDLGRVGYYIDDDTMTIHLGETEP